MLLALVVSTGVTAATPDMKGSLATTIAEQVREHYNFHGLAFYYNNLSYYVIDTNNLHRIDTGVNITLRQGQWLAIAGRMKVLIIQGENIKFHLDNSELIIDSPITLKSPSTIIKVLNKYELSKTAPELGKLRYVHLWAPLSWLAKLVESSLVAIHTHVINNWALTIVLFSLLLKITLLPVGIMTVRFQRSVSLTQSQLAPQLKKIKENYDGEDAHIQIMDAHRALGVSPFFTLKPMLGSFIQIPILIAVFNALGEMPQFLDQSFLWIENLAYPDSIGRTPFVIPMLGNSISILPFIMIAVSIFSTVTFQNVHASEETVKSQKRNLYLMSVAFFILFYPFPAAMVLYWTLNNTWAAIQQRIIKL